MSAREHHAPERGKSGGRQTKRPKCPICGKPRADAYRPFCSKHCADVDLGRWLGGRYAVPGEPVMRDDADEDDR